MPNEPKKWKNQPTSSDFPLINRTFHADSNKLNFFEIWLKPSKPVWFSLKTSS